MNFDKFKLNFNFVSNIFILVILFFGGFIWADSNGIWTDAKDIRGGTFGSDEQPDTTNYTFINPVYINDKLKSINSNYYIDIDARTQLNDFAVNNLSVSSTNCGKLYTDSFGKVKCGTDNVLSLPTCASGEVITSNGTALNCVSASSGGSTYMPYLNHFYGLEANTSGTMSTVVTATPPLSADYTISNLPVNTIALDIAIASCACGNGGFWWNGRIRQTTVPQNESVIIRAYQALWSYGTCERQTMTIPWSMSNSQSIRLETTGFGWIYAACGGPGLAVVGAWTK